MKSFLKIEQNIGIGVSSMIVDFEFCTIFHIGPHSNPLHSNFKMKKYRASHKMPLPHLFVAKSDRKETRVFKWQGLLVSFLATIFLPLPCSQGFPHVPLTLKFQVERYLTMCKNENIWNRRLREYRTRPLNRPQFRPKKPNFRSKRNKIDLT